MSSYGARKNCCAGESTMSQSPRMGLSLMRERSEVSDGSVTGSTAGSPNLRRRASIVAAKSFKSDGISTEPEAQFANSWFGKFRKVAHFLVTHHYVSNFMGVVVVFDAYFTGFDIDSRALELKTPDFILLCSDICCWSFQRSQVLCSLYIVIT